MQLPARKRETIEHKWGAGRRAWTTALSILVGMGISGASIGRAASDSAQPIQPRETSETRPRAGIAQDEAAELAALLRLKLEANGYMSDATLQLWVLHTLVERPYALLGYYIATPGQVPESFSPEIAVAVESGDGWNVLLAAIDRESFNAALDALPASLLPADSKPMYRYHPPGGVAPLTTYSGHYLPWPTGISWPVTQWPGGCGSHCSDDDAAYAYDFGIAYGRSIWASKTGTVAYAVDHNAASPLSWNPDWGLYCSAPGSPANYVVINHDQGASLYLHLKQYSVPGGLGPGATWRRGNRVGESGNVGYVCSYTNTPTSGAHLHYQVQEQGIWWEQSASVDFTEWNEASANPVSANTPEADPTCSAPTFAPDSLRVAVIGDFGIAGQPESDVAARVASWAPELVLTVGDNNYPNGEGGTIDANIGQYYRQFICPYLGGYGAGGSANRFFPALGNHDWVTSGAQPYLDYFALPGNERYYDFVAGPVHFFVVDSDSHEPSGYTAGSVQGLWLQAALAASTSAWNVVLLHHAPYSSGDHGPTTTAQWPYAAWGADAVLAGHDHTYERILRDGIPYFVNGLGGRSIYGFGIIEAGSMRRYNGDYGAMLLDADTDNLTFKFITRTGLVVDSYTLGPHMPARSDFDGDGRTDPAKFVPATGKVWWLRSSDARWASADLGTDTTSYVPRSDFDGDGRADPAKFLSSGALYYIGSNTGTTVGLYVGADYNTAASGSDFDGDGKTDPAKYLPEGAVWYYKSSTASWQGEFIGPDAVPYLPASDYDGDGKTDMAKYISIGAIWYLKSSTGTWDGAYIGSDGTPIAGSDFDGDGKTDVAKFLSGSNSLWYQKSSTGTWEGVYMGPGAFQYITASDFDGDGKTDPAKFDAAGKVLWWIKSTTGAWDGAWLGAEDYQVVN